MLKIGNPANFRRTFTGLTLFAAPLAGLIGALFAPQFTGGMEGELAFIAAHPKHWLASDFLTLVTFLLLIPAVFGLMHLLHDRAVALGHIGTGLTVLGAYFHAAIIGYALVEVPLVAMGGDQAQMIVFTDQMYGHTAFSMILAPFLSFYIGLLLLVIALWRAQVAPLWVTIVIITGLLAEFFGPEAVSPELMFVLLLVGFGWIGLKVLRMTDAQWEYGSTAMSGEDKWVGQPARAN